LAGGLALTMSRPVDSSVPEPDADARVHSDRLRAEIAHAIDAADGFLPFDRYMQMALYAPGLGYYVAGARKFGSAGDFVTAPELTPLFGRALAAQVDSILAATQRREIVELGAGSGRLASDLLSALAAMGKPARHYFIIEVSAELRERQHATIERLAPSELANVEWTTQLPARIEGAIVMNEVLDAVPVHLIARRGGAWLERGVSLEYGRLAWAERPLRDARLIALAANRFPAVGDYASELNPAAEALVEHVGRRLATGALLVVDYGFTRAEYYLPERNNGTLMGHYRHRAHDDPFLWPGLSDLTAHVDFTAIAEAGERAGLAVAGFTAQASFLLACGLLDRLRETGPPESLAYLREASAVQTLTSMSGMGELFKVLALARGEGIDWKGFALSDRSHRL
jgi:SAM-dependent MidA family methyltransferase